MQVKNYMRKELNSNTMPNTKEFSNWLDYNTNIYF